jgi:hypothetical protein
MYSEIASHRFFSATGRIDSISEDLANDSPEAGAAPLGLAIHDHRRITAGKQQQRIRPFWNRIGVRG